MNRYKSLVAVFAFALFVLILPSTASAQWGGNNRRNNDYYGRNNRNLNSTVRNLKNRSREFERRIDRELDRSRIDGSRREDRINDIAAQFARAADDLDDSYDNRGDYNNSQNEAQRVLQLGSQLNRALGRGRLTSNIQNDWSRIQQDLRVLANAYGGNYNDDYRNNRRGRNNRDDDYDDDDYRNNRNNRNGDWRSRIPFPIP